jgi:hypothetical protein
MENLGRTSVHNACLRCMRQKGNSPQKAGATYFRFFFASKQILLVRLRFVKSAQKPA